MDTATEHDAEPVAAAPASPGDDCGSDDPLVQRIADAIDRYVWHRTGPHDAALRVLGDPTIHDALRAADVVRALAEQHKPRRWDDLSSTVVCDTCRTAYPCPVADVVGGWMT